MRYSKRKLSGLPIPKEIKVNSLSKYISLFSNGQLNNCIFRGEPTNYIETISSALRIDTLYMKNNTKNEYPFIKMKNDFKREVWHKLSQDERNYFLAFSQHHGIPTNLIDFTTSPLVALYFACQPFKNNERGGHDENRGFVYLLEDKMIDITNLISKNEDDNILELFARNKNNLLLEFYELFLKYEREYPFEFYSYFKKLNESWHYYFRVSLTRAPIRKKFPAYNNGEYKNSLLYYLSNFINKDKKHLIDSIEEEYGEISFEALIYTMYLQQFLSKIINYTEPVWWINCMPIFKYSPILSFDRGRNQQGLFVYQMYLSFIESVYRGKILAGQRIWPNFIIVIDNKELILKELDFIGINEKFIYGDYDNIASYFKSKY